MEKIGQNICQKRGFWDPEVLAVPNYFQQLCVLLAVSSLTGHSSMTRTSTVLIADGFLQYLWRRILRSVVEANQM